MDNPYLRHLIAQKEKQLRRFRRKMNCPPTLGQEIGEFRLMGSLEIYQSELKRFREDTERDRQRNFPPLKLVS